MSKFLETIAHPRIELGSFRQVSKRAHANNSNSAERSPLGCSEQVEGEKK
jgi:hypothetical protein